MKGVIDTGGVKNYKGLPTFDKLLFLLFDLSRSDGTIHIKKIKLAEYLGLTEQAVGGYLRRYAEHNILKYKYSGEIIFNPNFYCSGTTEDKHNALIKYNNF